MSRVGSAATYRALMEVFVRAGRMRCAESVAEILKEPGTTETPG
jgi:pentatricopeptide repeat protein